MVIAGTHSGVGKTTVATGIMSALRGRGLAVAAAKVGPDFIDPGYHGLATGRQSRNLDSWISGRESMAPLAGRAAEGVDVLVVEGVMGLFDGASEDSGATGLPSSSTAAISRDIAAPVVLVIDAAAMSQSVAALLNGYATFSPEVTVAAVILNRVGSDAHEDGLRRALAPSGVEVIGCLRRDDSFAWRDRHLGLVPVVENLASTTASLDLLGAAIERSVDLEALMRLASSAPPLCYDALAPAEPQASTPVRIAVAGGKAFSFVYPENLERLGEAGGEIVRFDPVSDGRLPEGTSALYAGGGFPEVFADDLAANTELLGDVRRKVASGMATWAECGGLLWLSEALGSARLCGALPTRGEMTGQLTLGYRRAIVRKDNPIAARGAELRGHEFHYSVCEPPGQAFEMTGREGTRLEGFASPTLLATYLHLHLGSAPSLAERFVKTAVSGEAPASS